MILTTKQKLRLAKLAFRMVRVMRGTLGQPMEGCFVRNRLRWELDLREGVDFSIFLLGRFEAGFQRAYSKLIEPGSVILDLGANIGAHTLPFACLAGPEGRVFAVEATQYGVNRLRRQLELNPDLAGLVEVAHVLLVEAEQNPAETAIFARWPLDDGQTNNGHGDDPATGRHVTHEGQRESIGQARATTLDVLMAEWKPARLDWIKLDVDGHEVSVLRGARQTIEKFRPRILLELAPSAFGAEGNAEFRALADLLEAARYHLLTLPGRSPLPSHPEDLEKAIPFGASINCLALPAR